MSRLRSRLLVPVLAVIVLAVFFPALATAVPQREAVLSAVERQEAAAGRLSQLWSRLSVRWAKIGSVLDPDGRPEPDAANTGDTGSGLEPDGRP